MMSELSIHKNGAVYTPERLSHYVAEKTLQYTLSDPAFKTAKEISAIDPACGDGVLLRNIVKMLLDKKEMRSIKLCGTDFDDKAITLCKQKLQKSFDKRVDLSLINTNALCPFEKHEFSKGWKSILEKTSVRNGFDILIANPPWGADLSEYKNKLDEKQFVTLQRQVDSFELFMELATNVVKTGGYFAFIVPDSLLNHGKSILRDILVTSTEIKFIARLGEKIFPGINRACVVIICKNSLPSKNNLVDCFRLTNNDRAKILSGKFSYSESEILHAHKVPQKRFAKNPYNQFDIDLRKNETTLLNKLRKGNKTLADVLSNTRGVELGSSGMICECKKCGTWAPLSEKKSIVCSSCRKKFFLHTAKKTSITTEKKIPNSVPLITGRDLKRYECKQSKWIILGKKGITYKAKNTYQSPKILIRKTGVGLTAALDYSSAYTTQVVYIFRNKQKSNPGLEFFIALINSRAYYFFLSKSFGELEWKSHPYLTQSQILDLPLPDLKSDKNKKITFCWW